MFGCACVRSVSVTYLYRRGHVSVWPCLFSFLYLSLSFFVAAQRPLPRQHRHNYSDRWNVLCCQDRLHTRCWAWVFLMEKEFISLARRMGQVCKPAGSRNVPVANLCRYSNICEKYTVEADLTTIIWARALLPLGNFSQKVGKKERKVICLLDWRKLLRLLQSAGSFATEPSLVVMDTAPLRIRG